MKVFLSITCILLSILSIVLAVFSLNLLDESKGLVEYNESLKSMINRVTTKYELEYKGYAVNVLLVDHTNYSNKSSVEVNDYDFTYHVSREDLIVLAKMIWGETRLVRGFYATLDDGSQRYVSNTEQIAATVWTVLNRVDAGIEDSIIKAVTAYRQYVGYSDDNPVIEDYVNLACDCIIRWQLEKSLEAIGMNSDVGRVLPKPTETEKWCWFKANETTTHNLFRGNYWTDEIYDWHLSTPYEYDMPIY